MRVPLTVNLGIARRRLAGLRFDIDLGLKGKERIGGEDMKFVYSLLARGDRGYWVPDAEIVHPFPFDRLKFEPMLRQYLADGRCFARMTGGGPATESSGFRDANRHRLSFLQDGRCNAEARILGNVLLVRCDFRHVDRVPVGSQADAVSVRPEKPGRARGVSISRHAPHELFKRPNRHGRPVS